MCCVAMPGGGKASAAGFTLIEVVFVLGIMAVLAAIAIPNWGTLLPAQHLRGAARQVESELYRIKSRAVAENVNYQLNFSAAADNYIVERVEGLTITWQGIKPLPDGLDVRNSVILSFTPRGTASGNTLRLCNNKNEGYNIVLSGTGRIRICRPSVCDGSC
jgi:prepilin-type N-terminal cleavage/methylation domain-containing protein